MWCVVRRVFAGLGLLVALASLGAFVGAAVVVWQIKEEANRRTEVLATKAGAAVDAADHAVEFVRRVIDQGYHDLDAARKTNNAIPPEPVNPFFRATALQASRNLAGSVERANAAVITASDAVVVGEAALELFGADEQLKGWLGVKPEQLAQTRTDLGAASRELKGVRTLLGVPVIPAERPTEEQLVTVESALGQARGLTDQMGRMVGVVRQRVDQTKRAVDLWVSRLALIITAVGVVGATGQFFMARACWRALRNKSATEVATISGADAAGEPRP